MNKSHIIILATLSILFGMESLIAKDGCAKGWHKNKEKICVLDSKKYIENNQENEDQDRYESIITYLAQQSFIDQFSALAAAGIANITNAQIPTISNSIIPFMSNDQILQFTASQIALFTINQIPALTPGQVLALNALQVSSLTPAQIAAMLPEQIAAMSINQLNIVLPKLSPVQTKALTKIQISGLSAPALASQIPNLANHQIDYILVSQIQGLSSINTTPNPISLITVDHINNMMIDQLSALKTILQNSAVITTSNNANLGTQLSAIAVAPGKGFTGDDAPAAKVSRKDDRSYIGSSVDKSTGLYQLNRKTGVAKTNAAISRSIKKTNKMFGIK